MNNDNDERLLLMLKAVQALFEHEARLFKETIPDQTSPMSPMNAFVLGKSEAYDTSAKIVLTLIELFDPYTPNHAIPESKFERPKNQTAPLSNSPEIR